MIPVSGYEGKRVGVLGLARSGLAAARALSAGGAVPVCWDDKESARTAASEAGLQLADLTDPATWPGIVLLVISPGIPHLYPHPHPAIVRAWQAGVPVDNDVGLFMAELARNSGPAGMIESVTCVTGSNGKSTTTALIAHMLNGAERRAVAVGNIGTSVLEVTPEYHLNVVLELSSYQTDVARLLRPDVAVLLNVTPDHLERHGGMGGYFAAKRRLMDAVLPEAMIVGVDEPEGRFLASQRDSHPSEESRVSRISVKGFRTARGHVFSADEDGIAEFTNGEPGARVKIPDNPALRGRHNWQNTAAAIAACRALGISATDVAVHLAAFPGLPHRMEEIAVISNVRFVNDSKATNADAADKSLASFDGPIYWILGGRPKEGGLAGLEGHYRKIARAYLIGEAAGEFAEALGNAVPHQQPGTLDKALAAAARDAFSESSDPATVLLAPACASFDLFDSFEARGEAFRAGVQTIKQQREATV